MAGLGQIGRPKSESHGSGGGIPLIDEDGETKQRPTNGSLNPFQDDSTELWQHRNSSTVSSPEVEVESVISECCNGRVSCCQVAVDTNYSYQYKRVTAGPSTPELTLRSSTSSPPPTPVLIQVSSTLTTRGGIDRNVIKGVNYRT